MKQKGILRIRIQRIFLINSLDVSCRSDKGNLYVIDNALYLIFLASRGTRTNKNNDALNCMLDVSWIIYC